MPILEARKLCKSFDMGEQALQILYDIDFQVEAGEFVAIMGPSGSGKSTLLYLLGGLDSVTGGEVILGGQDISTLKDKDASTMRRREMGFIFQFYNLMPVLNVEENVTLPIILDNGDVNQYKSKLEHILKMVGLENRREHKPNQLSGGQQQRVAIARALINDPKVILADEPTGNLDSKTGEEILHLLRTLCDEEGRTVVMVTHDPRVAGYADRIVNLRDGRIEGETRVTYRGEKFE